MSPKQRSKKNAGLPSRWRFKHGAYYYRVPAGMEHNWDGKTEFRLGKTLAEAYRTWSRRLDLIRETRTIGDLLDRYAAEVLPEKSQAHMARSAPRIKKLKAVFGNMPLTALRPSHIYQYADRRSAKTEGLREIELLRHAFTMAVRWGLIDRHPFKGEVRLKRPAPRTRYVEDWELIEALSVAPPKIRAYIRLKLLTGLRRRDLLRMQWSQIKEDGIHVTTSKTGKKLVIEWTDELRQAIEEVRNLRRSVLSLYLFHERRGGCYIKEDGSCSGWDSLWQRFMRRVMEETNVTERFTEHDLRAKCASDAASLEHARALLAHADEATTRRIYRRKPERVRPLK